MQFQCRKVDNVKEEGSWHFGNILEGKGFKGG